MDEFDKMMWAYRAVFKQTNAGGGLIAINIVARERTVLLYGTIGPNDYAADRTIHVRIRDAAGGNVIARVLYPSAIDNEPIPMWYDSLATVATETPVQLNRRIVLGLGDTLTFELLTPIQNEELTIALRALFTVQQPEVNSTGSVGTVGAPVVTYDKVV